MTTAAGDLGFKKMTDVACPVEPGEAVPDQRRGDDGVAPGSLDELGVKKGDGVSLEALPAFAPDANQPDEQRAAA